MNRSTFFVRALATALAAAAAGLVACGGSGGDASTEEAAAPPAPPVLSTIVRVVVSPTGATLQVGESIDFQATALDADDHAVAAEIKWLSSEPSRAVVDAHGHVTAVAAGAVAVTALAGSVRSGAVALAVTGAAPAGAGSSFDRIEAARRDGTLDLDTATLYAVYATFADARLPAAFRGDDHDVAESDALDRARERWSALGEATRAAIVPFLVPPIYRGSWSSARAGTGAAGRATPQALSDLICQQPAIDPNWAAKPATDGGRFKVWYDTRVAGANTQATALLAELESSIWPTLVERVGLRAPLADGGLVGCNGGDARLDVYLVDMAVSGALGTDLGETFTAQIALKQRPAFILLKRGLSPTELRSVAAHEFAHASQWAYSVAALSLSSYEWLKESTAQWAIDAVYPVDQIEQRKASAYFALPDKSLDDLGAGADRKYGSYLFFQHQARTTDIGVVGRVWEATTRETEPAKAVDVAIAGGFRQQWPLFVKALWNQDPVADNSFTTWDALTTTPTLRGGAALTVALGGRPGATQTLDGNIRHLAAHYYQFRIVDPNVRSLVFYNHLETTRSGDVTTQAFVKRAGSIWQYEHWSDEGFAEAVKSSCLDLVAERIEDLVIVMANHHPTRDVEIDAASAPRISVSNVGCWRYQGTASVIDDNATAAGTNHSSVDGTATFERWRPQGLSVPGKEIFAVVGGAVTGHSTQTDIASCTRTIDGLGQMPAGVGSGTMTVDLGVDLGRGSVSRHAGGSGGAAVASHSVFQCPDVPAIVIDSPVSWVWMSLPALNETSSEVAADGSIRGSYVRPAPPPATGTQRIGWSFTPLRQ